MFRAFFIIIGLLVVLFLGIGVAGAIFGLAPMSIVGIAPGGGGLMVSHSPAHGVFMLLPVMMMSLVLLAGLFLLIGFISLLRRMFSGGGSRARAPRDAGAASQADEMAVMRELMDGMHRMGQRVESLETILIDRGRR